MQLILSIFYILWLSGVFILLVAIWRNGVRYTRQMEQTQLRAVMASSDAAKTAAEAAHLLASRVAQMQVQVEDTKAT